MYAQKLEGDSWKGEKLDKAKFDKMSGKALRPTEHAMVFNDRIDQQVGQLYELMQAIQKQEREGGNDEPI